MTDQAECKRLVLRLARDQAERVQLRILLAAADTTVRRRRLDLRNLRARIARRSPATKRVK